MEDVFTPQFVQDFCKQAPLVAALIVYLWRQLQQHDRHITGLVEAVRALAVRVAHVEERLGVPPEQPPPLTPAPVAGLTDPAQVLRPHAEARP